MNILKKLRAANCERNAHMKGLNVYDVMSHYGLELNAEVGELTDLLVKFNRQRFAGNYGSKNISYLDIKDEIADVIITADLIAGEFGIDLDAAIKDKFNKTSRRYGLPVIIKEDCELVDE